jgi:hypothetical protein
MAVDEVEGWRAERPFLWLINRGFLTNEASFIIRCLASSQIAISFFSPAEERSQKKRTKSSLFFNEKSLPSLLASSSSTPFFLLSSG